MASYEKQVGAIHRKFGAKLRQAKTRKAVLKTYWKHAAEHRRLLQRHLKDEMKQVRRVKNKIPSK